jgi:hypothetical protein
MPLIRRYQRSACPSTTESSGEDYIIELKNYFANIFLEKLSPPVRDYFSQ